jgi:hypothetical protein
MFTTAGADFSTSAANDRGTPSLTDGLLTASSAADTGVNNNRASSATMTEPGLRIVRYAVGRIMKREGFVVYRNEKY